MCKSVNDRTLIFVFIREKKKKKVHAYENTSMMCMLLIYVLK